MYHYYTFCHDKNNRKIILINIYSLSIFWSEKLNEMLFNNKNKRNEEMSTKQMSAYFEKISCNIDIFLENAWSDLPWARAEATKPAKSRSASMLTTVQYHSALLQRKRETIVLLQTGFSDY